MKAIMLAAAVTVAAICSETAWGAAGEAQVRLSCSSVRMQRGTGGLYTLDISSVEPSQSVNGELGPFSDNYTHAAYFALNDPSGLDPMQGIIHLDVPLGSDANGNGYGDFFEVAEDGSGTSSGVYSIPGVVSSGTVSVRWTRAAGSSQGSCVVSLQNLGDFTHVFEIIEYKGTLKYKPGANKVSGTIQLTLTGNPGNTFGGAIEFLKSGTDPYNQLNLSPGVWTNNSAEALTYPTDLFKREGQPWRTNYYGSVEFENDSNPGSFYPYGFYLLSIDDLNDRDQDGIPDLSDEPSSTGGGPALSLSVTTGGLTLTITGEAGMVCDVQQAGSPVSGNWQTVGTVSLSGSTAQVQLPSPTGSAGFWRVRVQ